MAPGPIADPGDPSRRPAAEAAGVHARGEGPDEDHVARGAEAEGQPSRRQELAREVVLQLNALRTSLDEALQNFGARVHGELAAAARRLEDAAAGESEVPLPSAKALEGVLHDLRAVKVKPRKGRAKDLRRISRAAEDLAELAEEP